MLSSSHHLAFGDLLNFSLLAAGGNGADLPVWSAVIFVLLVATIWKLGGKTLFDGLDNREKAIAENLAAAERSQAEAKRFLAEYEQKLAGAAAEIQALLDEARRDAEHTKQLILTEAKASAEAEQNRAVREISTATDGALKQLAEASAEAAVAIAGRVIGSHLGASDQSRLVQEAMERFPRQVPSVN